MTRRVAGVVGLAGAAVLLTAVPASAHVGGGGPSPSNWRSQVTSVSPPMPGVTVRTLDNGDVVELVNRSDVVVSVLGYDGEPYLRFRPGQGVEQNTRSAATYLNRTTDGRTEPPAQARDPRAAPRWEAVSGGTAFRWHDHRTHWMQAEPPPAVRADPSRAQEVSRWTLDVRYGTTPVAVSGTLSWVPPPSPWPWYGLAAGLAVVAGAVGWLPARRSRTAGAAGGAAGATGAAVGAAGATTAVLVGVLVASDVVHTVGDGLSGGAAADVPAWAAGVLAVVLWLRRSQYASLVTGLVGAVTAVVSGLGDLGTLTHSQVPFTGPDGVARACVAIELGLGAGLVAAVWGLSRYPAPQRPPRREAPRPRPDPAEPVATGTAPGRGGDGPPAGDAARGEATAAPAARAAGGPAAGAADGTVAGDPAGGGPPG